MFVGCDYLVFFLAIVSMFNYLLIFWFCLRVWNAEDIFVLDVGIPDVVGVPVHYVLVIDRDVCSVQVLYLSSNKINKIPTEVCEMKNLEVNTSNQYDK